MRARTFGSDGSPPRTAIWPEVGRTSPIIILIVVVLPAPLVPRKPRISPRFNSTESPVTALTGPKSIETSLISSMCMCRPPPPSASHEVHDALGNQRILKGKGDADRTSVVNDRKDDAAGRVDIVRKIRQRNVKAQLLVCEDKAAVGQVKPRPLRLAAAPRASREGDLAQTAVGRNPLEPRVLLHVKRPLLAEIEILSRDQLDTRIRMAKRTRTVTLHRVPPLLEALEILPLTLADAKARLEDRNEDPETEKGDRQAADGRREERIVQVVATMKDKPDHSPEEDRGNELSEGVNHLRPPLSSGSVQGLISLFGIIAHLPKVRKRTRPMPEIPNGGGVRAFVASSRSIRDVDLADSSSWHRFLAKPYAPHVHAESRYAA